MLDWLQRIIIIQYWFNSASSTLMSLMSSSRDNIGQDWRAQLVAVSTTDVLCPSSLVKKWMLTLSPIYRFNWLGLFRFGKFGTHPWRRRGRLREGCKHVQAFKTHSSHARWFLRWRFEGQEAIRQTLRKKEKPQGPLDRWSVSVLFI